MNADDVIKILPQIATIVGALASLIASIVAAIKASRAETESKNAANIAYEIRTIMQAQSQRQVQQVNINVATRGDAKGGEVIDLSGEAPARP